MPLTDRVSASVKNDHFQKPLSHDIFTQIAPNRAQQNHLHTKLILLVPYFRHIYYITLIINKYYLLSFKRVEEGEKRATEWKDEESLMKAKIRDLETNLDERMAEELEKKAEQVRLQEEETKKNQIN